MKKIREIRIVYRNWIFYCLRRVLPKTLHLELWENGRWHVMKFFPGCVYVIKCRNVRAIYLLEAIVFSAVINRRNKK